MVCVLCAPIQHKIDAAHIICAGGVFESSLELERVRGGPRRTREEGHAPVLGVLAVGVDERGGDAILVLRAPLDLGARQPRLLPILRVVELNARSTEQDACVCVGLNVWARLRPGVR
eukprot:4142209-Prymnesium_polylepis.3